MKVASSEKAIQFLLRHKILLSFTVAFIFTLIFAILGNMKSVNVFFSGLMQKSKISYYEKTVKDATTALSAESDYVTARLYAARNIFERTQFTNPSDYLPVLSREAENFSLSLPGFVGMRVINIDNKRIIYSSHSSDIDNSDAGMPSYRLYESNINDYPLTMLAPEDSSDQRIFLDADMGILLYVLVLDVPSSNLRSYIVAEFSLARSLFELIDRANVTTDIHIDTVSNIGLVMNSHPLNNALKLEIEKYWQSYRKKQNIKPAFFNNGDSSYILISGILGKSGFVVGTLFSLQELELPRSIFFIFLTTMFSLSFTLAFLLLSLRRDKLQIVTESLRRISQQMLYEYFNDKQKFMTAAWRKELEARKGEVRQTLRSIAGGFSARDAKTVDALIDDAWDEITLIFGQQQNIRQGPSEQDYAALLNLLSTGLRDGKLVLLPSAALTPQQLKEFAQQHNSTTQQITHVTFVDNAQPKGPTSRDKHDDDIEELATLEDEDIGELEELESVEPSEITSPDAKKIDEHK